MPDRCIDAWKNIAQSQNKQNNEKRIIKDQKYSYTDLKKEYDFLLKTKIEKLKMCQKISDLVFDERIFNTRTGFVI